jgi:drug/metabolite transporter (DMT)-like permease
VIAPTGLALAFGASLAWAGLDATRKRLAGHFAPAEVMTLLAVGQLPVFAVWAVSAGALPTDAGYVLPALGAFACASLGAVGFVRALQVAPLSVVVPCLALTPVLSLGFGLVTESQPPRLVQFAGGAAVVVGAAVLASGRGLAPEERARVRSGVVRMVGVAVLWAAVANLDRVALRHAPVPFHGALGALSMALVGTARFGPARWPDVAARAWSMRAVVAATWAFAAAAQAMQLQAFRVVVAGELEALKRTVGLAAAVVLGRVLFGERVTARGLAAVAVMAAGVVAVLRG